MSVLSLAEIVFFVSIALFLFGIFSVVSAFIAGVSAIIIALIRIVSRG